MIERAQTTRRGGYERGVPPGEIEALPIADASDVVISNCVINLVPDSEVFREIAGPESPVADYMSDMVLERLPRLGGSRLRAVACVSGAVLREPPAPDHGGRAGGGILEERDASDFFMDERPPGKSGW